MVAPNAPSSSTVPLIFGASRSNLAWPNTTRPSTVSLTMAGLHRSPDLVAGTDAQAGLGQVQLKLADILGRSRFGGPLEKRREPLAAADMAPLRAGTELARVHVLDHALTQRADGIRTHGKLLSWMRLTTPRSSRQGAPPATDDLSLRTVLATEPAGQQAIA